MKIIKPSVEVYFHIPSFMDIDNERHNHCEDLSKFIEQVGRTCYKSEDKITPDSARKFVKMLYEKGHHAMLEHCFASVKFICDRGVSHELVRHRICSYAQESTRYCNYSKEKFDKQITVIEPPGLKEATRDSWMQSCFVAENSYIFMTENGVSPQIARSILPTCLKTEIWCSANLREWMHIFNLRCSPQAHPQIREVMLMALESFAKEVPEMFSGIWNKHDPQKV